MLVAEDDYNWAKTRSNEIIGPANDEIFLFTSESVCEGHPDKLCDQISDAILDGYLREDEHAYVACETSATTNFILVFGEINSHATIDVEKVVRETVKRIGYDDQGKGLDYKTVKIMNLLHKQSPEIAKAVHIDKSPEELGAGDQGIMFGYATNETEALMPLSIDLAHSLGRRLAHLRKSHKLSYLRPDGKTQVTMEYAVDGLTKDLKPLRVHSVLISAQHDADIPLSQLQDDLKRECILPVIPSHLLDDATLFFINPSGSFVVGGPDGDAGLTGRKIIVDTYGGWGAHGGGAFSGKDPSKVDRSAAYAARWVAKSLVHSGLCDRAQVQLAYGIGIAHPLSINVQTFGTNRGSGISDPQMVEIVLKEFDLRPGMIIRDLDLARPIYSGTAAYGHFGGKSWPWEQPKDLSKYLKAPE